MVDIELGTVLACEGAAHVNGNGAAVVALGDLGSIALDGELAQSHVVPASRLIAVVVGRQSEGVQQQWLADQLLAVERVAAEGTLRLVEGSLEVSACDIDDSRAVVNCQGG